MTATALLERPFLPGEKNERRQHLSQDGGRMARQETGETAWISRRDPAPGCVVVSVIGEVDANAMADFEARLLEALADSRERLVVDLGEVAFFDSAAIRCLIVLRQRAGKGDDRLRLVMPRRSGVRRALDIARLDQLFTIAPNVDDALPDASASAASRRSARVKKVS
jgi:anti-sigma B factor antagonist